MIKLFFFLTECSKKQPLFMPDRLFFKPYFNGLPIFVAVYSEKFQFSYKWQQSGIYLILIYMSFMITYIDLPNKSYPLKFVKFIDCPL